MGRQRRAHMQPQGSTHALAQFWEKNGVNTLPTQEKPLFAVASWDGKRSSTDIVDHASDGDLNGVMGCIEAGANLDCRDRDGCTALIAACEGGFERPVAALLAGGAKVDVQDDWGCTALMAAVESCHLKIVSSLLAFGADITLRDDSGRTARSIARNNQGTVIATILDQAAQLDAVAHDDIKQAVEQDTVANENVNGVGQSGAELVVKI